MKLSHRYAYAAAVLSGMAGLIYQLLWQRELELLFGSTAQSISLILGVFFAGIALGSVLFGRLVDGEPVLGFRLPQALRLRPLLTYVAIELAIGLYGAASLFIIQTVGSLDTLVARDSGWMYETIRVVGVALALGIPTILMGGTLVVLVRGLARHTEELGESFSGLYSVNALGGALGVLLAGVWLIGAVGIYPVLAWAVALNITAALIGNRAARELGKLRIDAEPKPQTKQQRLRLSSVQKWLAVAVFLSGFASIGLEVIWTRRVVTTVGGSTYSFSLILVAVLFGLVAGSWLARTAVQQTKQLKKWLAISYLFTSVGALLTLLLLQLLPRAYLKLIEASNQNFNALLVYQSLALILLFIVPTMLMGFALPLAVRLFVSKHDGLIGREMGLLYGINTLGSVLGPLAAYYLMMRFLGLHASGLILSCLFFAAGGAVIMAYRKTLASSLDFRRQALVVLLLGAVLAVSVRPLSPFELNTNVFANAVSYLRLISQANHQVGRSESELEILYYEEGLTANVTTVRSLVETPHLALIINGKTDASTRTDMITQVLSGQLPAALNPSAKNALIVGLGSGVSAGSLAIHGFNQVDIVELIKEVPQAARYFSEYNNSVLDRDDVALHIDDARSYLRHSDQKYDIITAEPTNPWIAGVATLFTTEQFELYKQHMTDDGIAVQWLQTYRLDPEAVRTIIATFAEVFPEVSIWQRPDGVDIFVVGSLKPQTFDFNDFANAISPPHIAADLERVGFDSPLSLASMFVAGNTATREFSAGAAINSDKKPRLEFQAPRGLLRFTYNENAAALSKIRQPISEIFKYPASMQTEVEAYEAAMRDYLSALSDLRLDNRPEVALPKLLALNKRLPELGFVDFDLTGLLHQSARDAAASGDITGAIKLAEQALSVARDTRLDIRLVLAGWYLEVGRNTEAKRQLEYIVDLNPIEPIATERLRQLGDNKF